MKNEFQNKIPDDICNLLSQALPSAFARSVISYTEFSCKNPPDNAKDFIAYHNACKAALGHIGALVKIKDVCAKNSPAEKSQSLEELLRQARHLLDKTEN